MQQSPHPPLLEINNLSAGFGRGPGFLRVLNGISLQVHSREVLALAGESGCGKTTTVRAALGLLGRQGRILSGEIRFKGRPIEELEEREWRRIRGKEIGLVFQEPSLALNPLLSIGAQITEGMRQHGGLSRAQALAKAEGLLEELEIEDPRRCLSLYPHQLSGGMQQRVLVAVGLALDPDLLIADEPTSSLDALTQTQILRLFRRICEERSLGILLISHDLGAVAAVADRLALMREGRIVEQGPLPSLLDSPQQPHTVELLELYRALTRPDPAPAGLAEGQRKERP